MRTLALGLLAAIVIAILAGLAIWPAVADAPWEQEASAPVVEDRTDEIRCEGALSYREAVIAAGRRPQGTFSSSDFRSELSKAEREITRYC